MKNEVKRIMSFKLLKRSYVNWQIEKQILRAKPLRHGPLSVFLGGVGMGGLGILRDAINFCKCKVEIFFFSSLGIYVFGQIP